MSELIKLFGEQIRNIRKEKGMTQEALTNEWSFQYSYISDIERGERNISVETLEKIIGALDVVPAEIFNFTHATTDNEVIEKRMVIESIRALLVGRNIEEVKFIHRVANDFVKTVDQTENKK
ncbi:helix-turn-helix domain-containing protein [Paenibacillus naphthalenovorans]|uniref:Xre family transcriptional regulator n=1 Tax=Paenibacillus naphthalenovorans TaxID=162209 RepID=A0A0U2VXZ6_9BACL|nr:helix-turn-helix transcriptional regulator [Paenibacillus naphthalenovorans]ALS24359.1 Xre family transcriptional regulator [Paenibacillus naphthalenovorans]